METRDMHKELVLFYVTYLNVPLYIQWDQFIIVQVTLPTPSHQVPSNYILDWKRFSLNLLNVVTLLTLKVILRDHPTRLKKYWLYSNRNCQSQPSKIQEYCCPNCLCTIKTKLSQLIYQRFGRIYNSRLKRISRKVIMEVLPKILPDLGKPCYICLLNKATKINRVTTPDVSKFAPGFMLRMDFFFQCWNHPWIYIDSCGYILCYFMPLCIYIQKQTSTSWNPQIYCHCIEEAG